MKVARFMHVSPGQFGKDLNGEGAMRVEEIPLPRRATAGSAGYDFVSPLEVTIPAGGTALIPTGILSEKRGAYHGEAPQSHSAAGDHRAGRAILSGDLSAIWHRGGRRGA